LIFAALTIFLVVVLQQKANTARNAEVTLALTESDVVAAQVLPFLARVQPGISPAATNALIDGFNVTFDATIAGLRRSLDIPELNTASRSFDRYTASLKQVAAHVEAEGFKAVGGLTTRQAFAEQQTTMRHLRNARATYGATAERAMTVSRFGSIAAILALLGAFGFFYWRSVREHAQARRLSDMNEQLLAQSRVEACTDALTGLQNRRALTTDLEREIPADGPVPPAALVLFDLDGFKSYNDTFGHPEGDKLLERLSARLREVVRGRGTAYRMGGDEFCVLVPIGNGNGDVIANSCVAALTDRGDGFSISCSFGSVVVPDDAGTPEEALRLADQRMYKHKASGGTSAERRSSNGPAVQIWSGKKRA
jgi:diguanylate cyclase (GGDEF)-like protein